MLMKMLRLNSKDFVNSGRSYIISQLSMSAFLFSLFSPQVFSQLLEYIASHGTVSQLMHPDMLLRIFQSCLTLLPFFQADVVHFGQKSLFGRKVSLVSLLLGLV